MAVNAICMFSLVAVTIHFSGPVEQSDDVMSVFACVHPDDNCLNYMIFELDILHASSS